MPVDLPTLLRRCWHPACSLEELAATERGVLPVRLCGERIVVADLGDGPVALEDRCPHRSTRLSLGWVDGDALQCAYHGWRWSGDGRCVGVPSMPDGSGTPARRVPAYEVEVRYGLVWVRLEAGWPTEIPACPAWDDPTMRAVAGPAYTWPVSTARRVENFVDLPHLAWVHDGTLADRRFPQVPEVSVRRDGPTLRFRFEPPALPDADPVALVGASDYVIALNGSVHIAFDVPGVGRRDLWMSAAPVDAGSCRTYWFTSRSDNLDGDDRPHLDFQAQVLAEDEPVVCGQDPPDIPWAGDEREVSVRTDAVSLAYRRLLLDAMATDTPAEMAALLGVLAPAR